MEEALRSKVGTCQHSSAPWPQPRPQASRADPIPSHDLLVAVCLTGNKTSLRRRCLGLAGGLLAGVLLPGLYCSRAGIQGFRGGCQGAPLPCMGLTLIGCQGSVGLPNPSLQGFRVRTASRRVGRPPGAGYTAKSGDMRGSFLGKPSRALPCSRRLLPKLVFSR